MKIQLKILIGFIVFIQSNLLSQELPRIDLQLLNQKQHERFEEADACVLFSELKIKYDNRGDGLKMYRDYRYRIKFYNENREGYGTFEIPFYEDKEIKEEVIKISGVTYNVQNDKLITTRLEETNIFEEQTTENWQQKKFAMPNVKEGSVIDVSYTVVSEYLYTFPIWFFQHYIPVDSSVFRIKVPINYSFTPVATGTIPFKVESKDDNSNITNDSIYIYSATNIPAQEEDKYVLNEDDFRSSLKFEISSVTFLTGEKRVFSEDWNAIGNYILKSDYFGKEIERKRKELRPIIEQALDIKDLKSRLVFIYDFVKDEYTWNKSYGKYKDKGSKELIKNKTGNIGDINLQLIHLLNETEFEVYPIVTKRRSSGLLNPAYPSSSELDYVFAYVLLNGKEYYLDATSGIYPLGYLPLRALNIYGLIVKKDASQIIQIKNPNHYQSVTIATVNFDEEDGSLKFECSDKLAKYAAVKFRANYEEDGDEEEDEQKVESTDSEEDGEDENYDEDDDLELIRDDEYELIEVENLEDIYKPIKKSYTRTKYSTHKIIGSELFINSDFDMGIVDHPFKAEARDYPIFFSQINDLRRIVNFTIPEGYELKFLPEKLTLSIPNANAQFIYDAKQIGDRISLTFYFKIGTDIILPQDYPALVDFYDRVINKQSEKIILERVD